MDRSIHDIAELVHPHPSITEGVLECARMLLGKSIIKPQCFATGLRCCAVRQGTVVTL
jgi:dihydrolipoamide dehydrogenase